LSWSLNQIAGDLGITELPEKVFLFLGFSMSDG